MLATQLSTGEKDRTERNNEQEEDEEVDMENCVTVRHVFFFFFYYEAAGSDDLLICFMPWGCALLVQLFIAWEFTFTPPGDFCCH